MAKKKNRLDLNEADAFGSATSYLEKIAENKTSEPKEDIPDSSLTSDESNSDVVLEEPNIGATAKTNEKPMSNSIGDKKKSSSNSSRIKGKKEISTSAVDSVKNEVKVSGDTFFKKKVISLYDEIDFTKKTKSMHLDGDISELIDTISSLTGDSKKDATQKMILSFYLNNKEKLAELKDSNKKWI